MPSRTVVTDRATYVVSFDDLPVEADRLSALVITRLVDEVSGEPAQGPIRIETTFTGSTGRRPGLAPRVGPDGIAGFVGVPRTAFPALSTQAYSVDATFAADGFVPYHVEVAVAAQPTFPAKYVLADLGDLPLRREPTMIRGRVIEVTSAGRSPVSGATVRMSGFWAHEPDPLTSTAASPPNVVAIHPALQADRDMASTFVRRRTLVIDITADKHLVTDVDGGATTISLTDRATLAAGDLLVIEAAPSLPDRREYAVVAAVDISVDPALPGEVTITLPLALAHRRGALVRRAVPQPALVTSTLVRDAVAGDGCLFLASVGGPATGAVVEISGGASPEYHDARRFLATSDVDGSYGLPPLNRVARVAIQAVAAGYTTVTREVTPTPGSAEERVDLVLY